MTARKMMDSTSYLERSEASTKRRHDGQDLQASNAPLALQATRINVGWAKRRAKKDATLIGCHANAKGTPATKGEQESAPTHLPEEEAVVEIVQDEAEAARTSADGKTLGLAKH